MLTLTANMWTLVGLLCVCSLYFSWKCRGGSLYKPSSKPGNGADILGEIFLFFGYIWLCTGLVLTAAVVGLITRVLLLIIAVHAFTVGDNTTGAIALAVPILTGVYSSASYKVLNKK